MIKVKTWHHQQIKSPYTFTYMRVCAVYINIRS